MIFTVQFSCTVVWKVVSRDSNLQNILEFLALGKISLWQHPSPILGWRGRERTISLSWSPSLCRAHERPKLSYRRSLSSLSCIFSTKLYIPVIYNKVRYWTPSNLLFIRWTIYVVLMLLTLKKGSYNDCSKCLSLFPFFYSIFFFNFECDSIWNEAAFVTQAGSGPLPTKKPNSTFSFTAAPSLGHRP